MKREVFVWSQTTHPNLHPLLGYRSQPRPRLISPWCRHGNLTHYLRNNPGLSRLDKLRLIFQAACGLEHLHAQSPPICHADIKPENVLVSDYFHAALSDFGLSRVLEGFGRPSGFTTSERIKGTLNYMAGELFTAENPRATLETDVYAFGGLILTVMSGKTPFQGLRESAVLFRITNDQPPHMEDHQGLPHSDPLWGLMRRCWTMTPEARPPMQEVLREVSPSMNSITDPDSDGEFCRCSFGVPFLRKSLISTPEASCPPSLAMMAPVLQTWMSMQVLALLIRGA
ncbi:hypothetical protein M407DRAFT_72330 [Tulasnella calospora MUT 4182]|uniref:Protein kinase domain-containing protein n=1 Tax=Tulasnella calospora MUT 4182 TaxID=1051891 RepID=A0A0C3M2Y3_9AGAM|nr:hypothetical protein M407DRAFT_72330 [Tulasnella calospora MUT 4182]